MPPRGVSPRFYGNSPKKPGPGGRALPCQPGPVLAPPGPRLCPPPPQPRTRPGLAEGALGPSSSDPTKICASPEPGLELGAGASSKKQQQGWGAAPGERGLALGAGSPVVLGAVAEVGARW